MRKINSIQILGFSVLLLSMAACKKSYLDTPATDRIAEEQAINTTDGCWKLLNGVHRIMYSSHMGRQDMVGQGTNMMDMDLMGEDITIA